MTESTPPAPPEIGPSRIVGIGASAGGLESLEQLFKNLPASTGMAFGEYGVITTSSTST